MRNTLAVLVFLVSFPAFAEELPEFISPAFSGVTAEAEDAALPYRFARRPVNLNESALQAERFRVSIGEESLIATRTDVDMSRFDGSTYHSVLDGAVVSSTVSYKNGAVSGMFVSGDGRRFRVETAPDGFRTDLWEVNTALAPKLGNDAIVPSPPPDLSRIMAELLTNFRSRRRPVRIPQVPKVVREGLIYSKDVLNKKGGTRQAEAFLQFSTDQKTAALRDSSCRQCTVVLAGTMFLDHQKLPTYTEEIYWLGSNPEVRAFRVRVEAMIVGFVGEMADVAGAGWRPLWEWKPEYGFYVADTIWLVDAYAGVHEFGHNLGFDHNPYSAVTVKPEEDPNPDARGHCVAGVWRDAMAYIDVQCGSPLLITPQFGVYSTPWLMFKGGPQGILHERDNMRVFFANVDKVIAYADQISQVSP